MKNSGLITKAVAGSYCVLCDEEKYECKARGSFRNKGESPLVGDYVDFEPENGFRGVITDIHERKNSFLRPPLSNLDKLFIVTSICEPAPSYIILDKLITICEYKDIKPIIVITKIDLKDSVELERIYTKAGFDVISISNVRDAQPSDLELLRAKLSGGISAFAGNTGVGKSSLLNNLYPKLALETSHISKKLGRGRHTTRHVELFRLEDTDGFVADTPGFGSIELMQYDIIMKDKLQYCFREFVQYLNKCRFTGCSHTVEKGCAVLEAYSRGEIEPTRLDSYRAMYEDAKEIKEWEHKCKK